MLSVLCALVENNNLKTALACSSKSPCWRPAVVVLEEGEEGGPVLFLVSEKKVEVHCAVQGDPGRWVAAGPAAATTAFQLVVFHHNLSDHR